MLKPGNGRQAWFDILTEDLWDFIPELWRDELEICRNEVFEIDDHLRGLSFKGEKVVPIRENIFAALAVAPSQVKVVILGQDPYPNANHAIGLAFAIPNGTKPLPGSLRNILAEVESDLGHSALAAPDLVFWVKQGVLLLNTTLTSIAGASNSHAHLPWDRVVNRILQVVVEANPKVVAILWGKSAQNYVALFNSEDVIASAHPSPLSAHRGFKGSRPFSRANEMLESNNQEEINW